MQTLHQIDALCEGYLRRGRTVRYTAQLYSRTASALQQLSSKVKAFKLIHFEELVKTPFETAERIFEFLDAPFSPDKLRIKSKKVLDARGRHEIAFGEESRKYCFPVMEFTRF